VMPPFHAVFIARGTFTTTAADTAHRQAYMAS
jgi:hypothetical protein